MELRRSVTHVLIIVEVAQILLPVLHAIIPTATDQWWETNVFVIKGIMKIHPVIQFAKNVTILAIHAVRQGLV